MTEDELYAKLFSRLPAKPADVVIPPGDDCAGIRFGPERVLLLAVDQTVGGRHYYETGPEAATPDQVARKLLARNLSDIAAMGGNPKYALVAISQHCGTRWLDEFYNGLLDMAATFGVYPIGGDWATSSHENICSLTIIGEVETARVTRRSGAKPGDRLFATGKFGQSLPSGHHLTFTPRCREGKWLAHNRFAKAMIDVSDGLLLDARRLCSASNVSAAIDPESVPLRTPDTTTQQALTDGEDYELIFAVAPDRAAELTNTWPFYDNVELTEIGHVLSPKTTVLTRPDGQPFEFNIQGYDHLCPPNTTG